MSPLVLGMHLGLDLLVDVFSCWDSTALAQKSTTGRHETAAKNLRTSPLGFWYSRQDTYGSTFLLALLRLDRIEKRQLYCSHCNAADRRANNYSSPNFIDKSHLNVDHVDYSIS
jgi:hypothetical protein